MQSTFKNLVKTDSVESNQNKPKLDYSKDESPDHSKSALVFPIDYEAIRPITKWTWRMVRWTYGSDSEDDKRVDMDDAHEHVLDVQNIKEREALIESLVCPSELTESLWEKKSSLDYWFDSSREGLYRIARQNVFPEEKGRPKGFYNRQGLKLKEVTEDLNFVGRLLTNQRASVLDVLGSVHVWPEFIFGHIDQLRKQGQSIPMNKIRVYGVVNARSAGYTSKSDFRNLKQRSLLTPSDYTVIPDLDIQDIIEPDMMERICQFFKKDDISPVCLVVTEGSILVSRDPETNEHLENYHEFYNSRCLLSQVVLALKVLAPGGDLVVKAFDMFSKFSVSLLYILRLVFGVVQIVKPSRSRPVNSERYITCIGYRDDRAHLIQVMHDVFVTWSQNQKLHEQSVPSTLVPHHILREDTLFLKTVQKMASTLCKRQADALEAVNEECKRLDCEANGAGKIKQLAEQTSPNQNTEQVPYKASVEQQHFRLNKDLIYNSHQQRRRPGYRQHPDQTGRPARVYDAQPPASIGNLSNLFTAIGVHNVKYSPQALKQFKGRYVSEHDYQKPPLYHQRQRYGYQQRKPRRDNHHPDTDENTCPTQELKL